MSKGSLGKEPSGSYIEKSQPRAFSPTQTTMLSLTENYSPTITVSRASLDMWPRYLRTRNFLVHRISPSISSCTVVPGSWRVGLSAQARGAQMRKASSHTWKGTRQVWWANIKTQRDPEEATRSWEAGEDGWSSPRNLSAALEKHRFGKGRLEKHGRHHGA